MNDKLKSSLRLPFTLFILFSLAVNILSLAAPLYAMQVFDRVLSSGNIHTLFYLTLIAVFLIIVMGIFSYVRSYIQFEMSECFSRAIKPYLLSLHLGGYCLSEGIIPEMSHAEKLRQFIAGSSFASLIDIMFTPIFALALYFIHPVLLIISIAGAALLLTMSYFNAFKNKSIQEKSVSNIAAHGHYTQSMLRAEETIKAMRFQRNIFSEWAKKEENLLKIVWKSQFGNKIFSEASKTFRIIIQLFVTGATGYYIVFGEMNPGALMAASVLAGKVIAPFEQIIAQWNQLSQARHAYAVLKKSVSQPIKDANISLGDLKGKIDVQKLSYKINDSAKTYLLENISFSLSQGECLVILGPSGSGKSTLLRSLVGIYPPTMGSVRIDGAEISQQYGTIGTSIGYMGQENDFLPASIKDNIARLDTSLSDQKIVQAAKNAGAHDMILALPRGYETQIGAGGCYLSAGQQQKIALARALVYAPKMLFLDEPNAHLDQAGEHYLAHMIKQLKGHKITCVIVSHRSSILEVADKCAVIQQGKLVQFSSIENLRKSVPKNEASIVSQEVEA